MDVFTPQQRSLVMSRIRGRDTGPELTVRSLAHKLGYRFRLHRRSLPGSPDLVFPVRRKVVFVHGCFWHRHKCGRAYQPKTRAAFWAEKFAGNVARDRKSVRSLRRAGWKVLIIWECQTSSPSRLATRLRNFLEEADSRSKSSEH
jgi:DNA mismatch endonuclease (patch repair protein)